jgi:hypothetical protein
MTFSRLASEYRLLELRLRRSLAGGAPSRQSADLLRRCADALDRLETYRPATLQEARDQVFFFLRRGMETNTVGIDNRNVDIALTLSARSFPDLPLRAAAAPEPDPATTTMIDYVTGSAERVSFIDTEFRYVATSGPNADFYQTRPIRVLGLHVADIIGSARFETRARSRFGACFAGDPQSYLHSVMADGRRHVMSCQMKPVRSETGEIDGALVYMRDVTAELPRLLAAVSLV